MLTFFIFIWIIVGAISSAIIQSNIAKVRTLNAFDALLLIALVFGGFLTAFAVYLDYTIYKATNKKL